MKGQKTNLLLGKLCAGICEGFDLSSGETHTCTTNVIRIAAKENSYIKSSVFGGDTTGIYLPGGTTEYFEVNENDVITVLSGEINISSVQ